MALNTIVLHTLKYAIIPKHLRQDFTVPAHDTSAQEVTVLCSSSFKFTKRHFGTSVLFSQLAVSLLSPSTVGISWGAGPSHLGPSTLPFSMETLKL